MRRFATREVAADLQQSGFALGGRVRDTVMFCDIRGFTSIAASQPPEETIELIDGATRARLDDRIAVEPLGAVQLKGKAAAIEVFAAPTSASAAH